jgi:hypothetical protein
MKRDRGVGRLVAVSRFGLRTAPVRPRAGVVVAVATRAVATRAVATRAVATGAGTLGARGCVLTPTGVRSRLSAPGLARVSTAGLALPHLQPGVARRHPHLARHRQGAPPIPDRGVSICTHA